MKERMLYIKIDQNVEVSNKKVYLEDLAKMYCNDGRVVKDLNRQVVMTIHATDNTKYCFSVMKIIELIMKLYPDMEIINLGETEFVVSYVIPKNRNKLLEYAKALAVCFVIFFGGAFSIMTFNTDVSATDVFDQFYELVMGTSKNGSSVLEVSYAIGLPIGILVFFNHFSRKKIHNDPTPIQIEMRKYEKDINEAVMADSSREGKMIDSN